ncbi:unnamed protein product [Pleuronectes platessa]|uniref:RabBD domain-containing protein n=1 Tax=Pleuronectes platessa TaxID=8262 RepID=A0A9N7V8K3_PLEPL|nr:unnamed protein product [Pleuronectes platessa]
MFSLLKELQSESENKPWDCRRCCSEELSSLTEGPLPSRVNQGPAQLDLAPGVNKRTWAPRESGRWRGEKVEKTGVAARTIRRSCGCRGRRARGARREVWLGKRSGGNLSAETTRRGGAGGGGGAAAAASAVVVEKMSASVGPQGGPRPPTAPPSMPDLPDLSHLTEEERKIIMAVMARQKEEEDKEQAMLK